MKNILDYIRNLSIGEIIESIVESITAFFVISLAAELYLPNNEYYNSSTYFLAGSISIIIVLSIVFIIKKFIK